MTLFFLFIALSFAAMLLILWQTDQQDKRRRARVSAFRQELFVSRPDLHAIMPSFEYMLEMTQTGVPLLVESYFSREQIENREPWDREGYRNSNPL